MIPSPANVTRILDVNANRAAEGLRVVEDHLRFNLNDGHLVGWCKRIRHELAQIVAQLPPTAAATARDAHADVGRRLKAEQEAWRPDPDSVLRANCKRAQQALRSLEEWAKLIATELAMKFEDLRYQVYELEAALRRTELSQQRLRGVQLYLLIDGGSNPEDFERRVGQLLRAGVRMVQLRDKRLSDRELIQRAARLMELTRATPTLVIINDRVDIALAVSAHGVHLGQDDLPLAEARRVLGPEPLVGVSTHSLEQARQAVVQGASYIGVGPTFASATKQFHDFPGPPLLRAVAGEIRLPSFAIGGIGLDELDEVLGCGMRRVAVSSAVWGAASPEAACHRFLERLAAAPAVDSVPQPSGAESHEP